MSRFHPGLQGSPPGSLGNLKFLQKYYLNGLFSNCTKEAVLVNLTLHCCALSLPFTVPEKRIMVLRLVLPGLEFSAAGG